MMSIFDTLRIIIDKAEEAVNEIKRKNLLNDANLEESIKQSPERRVFHINNVPYETIQENLEKIKNDVVETAEYNDLKRKLIEHFYMLPDLLLNYKISLDEIDSGIVNFKINTKNSDMTSTKMSYIFNGILEDYSNKVLFDMGVIDIDGHMKINPIDFCYPSNVPLTEQEKEVKFMKDTLNVIGDGNTISKDILEKQDEEQLIKIISSITVYEGKEDITDSDKKRLTELYLKKLEHDIVYDKIKTMSELVNDITYDKLDKESKIIIERYFLKNNGED